MFGIKGDVGVITARPADDVYLPHLVFYCRDHLFLSRFLLKPLCCTDAKRSFRIQTHFGIQGNQRKQASVSGLFSPDPSSADSSLTSTHSKLTSTYSATSIRFLSTTARQ